MDRRAMPIGAKFGVIHRAFRRELDAALREKDITGVQFAALKAIEHLERGGGEVSQHDVEALTHSSHPSMTEVLKKLEKKGFIEVRPSETDRRRKQLRCTERARELELTVSRVDEKSFEGFCAGLDAEQTRRLEEMLDVLLQNACGCFEKEGKEA